LSNVGNCTCWEVADCMRMVPVVGSELHLFYCQRTVQVFVYPFVGLYVCLLLLRWRSSVVLTLGLHACATAGFEWLRSRRTVLDCSLNAPL
jgi:hypothetical protein